MAAAERVQAAKAASFFRSMVPAAGWDLYHPPPAAEGGATQPQCRLSVATLVLCGAASTSGIALSPVNTSRVRHSLATLTEPVAMEDIPALCVQLLTCCVQTVSKTLVSLPPAGQPADSHHHPQAARSNVGDPFTAVPPVQPREQPREHMLEDAVLQPVLAVIDSHVGDLLALLPDAAVAQPAYAELAAAAAQHVQTAAAASGGPGALAVCRSARRLWAAFIREVDTTSNERESAPSSQQSAGSTAEVSSSRGSDSSDTESSSGSKDAEGDQAKKVQAVEGRDVVSGKSEESEEKDANQIGDRPIEADLDAGDANELSSDESEDSEDSVEAEPGAGIKASASTEGAEPEQLAQGENGASVPGTQHATVGRVGNVKVAVAALQALSAVATSDDAMAVLFDEEAVAARFVLPAAVADVALPLESVVTLGQLPDGPSGEDRGGVLQGGDGTAAQAASGVRTELLLLIEALVECAHTHLEAATATAGAEAAAVRAHLLSAAQLLLPQLLGTYHATMHPEDRACQLALRALDAAFSACTSGTPQPLTAPSPRTNGADASTRSGGDADDADAAGGSAGKQAGGFLSSMAFVWGRLWHHMQRSAAVMPEMMARHASCPDVVDPRRMALAALHFPEARTLDVSEQDPFHGSAALRQAPQACAAGYDPAAVVPAAEAMLRRGWLDARAIVAGGWLPLLMRCLGCADDGIRMRAYDALSLLFEEVSPPEGEQGASPGDPLREASQVLTLLTLIRNTVQQPFQQLSQASAVFLAEAAAAALNPTALLYAPLNSFLLRRAALPYRGLSMFSQLHDGQTRDWRRRRMHAHALALAAPQASAPRLKLAAAAAASPVETAAVHAFLSAAAASAELPASCMHMLRRGTLAHASAAAAAAVSSLHHPGPVGASPARGPHEYFANAVLALDTMRTAARAERLWRGASRNDAVATFTSSVWSMLGALWSLVGPAGAVRQAVALLQEFLDLVHTYLLSARAWHHSAAYPCSFELPFWQQVLDLAMCVTSPGLMPGCTSERRDVFVTIQQCILSSSMAAIGGSGAADDAGGVAPFPCQDAQAVLTGVWELAGAEPGARKQARLGKPPVAAVEPYSVRLLAWIVAGGCQRCQLRAQKGPTGPPLSTIPSVVINSVQAYTLQTLASAADILGSQSAPANRQSAILQLYRLASKMAGFSGSCTRSDIAVLETECFESFLHVSPKMLRAVCGALGAVAAGLEHLDDVMSQNVTTDENADVTPLQNGHQGSKNASGNALATVWSILRTVERKDCFHEPSATAM
eukprot:jgi/Ulvmu1/7317/UM035_0106.1